MIIVKLLGGLGNQMFQYAAARSLAEQNSTDVMFDLSWFDQDFDANTTPRYYELSCFSLDATAHKYDGTARARLRRRLAKQYTEPHFHYDENFKKLSKNAVLNGYFQSEKYFIDIREILLLDFTWKKKPEGKNQELLEQIQQDPSSVSVHVRRGDYVSNENAAKFHGLTGAEYYKAAVKQILQKVKSPKLYVFSDDPGWCKQNLKFTQPTTYISHNTDGSEDMRLMKACGHNIIANSSFSWWGAWLNTNPDKVVIGPSRWFSHPESNTKDVIPSTWHKM